MELFKLFGKIAVENNEANSSIDETTGKAEKSEGRMSSAFKKIGAAVAAGFATDKIIEFGKSIVDASATVSAEQSAFEQIMGEYSDTAQQKVNEIADTTGMVSTRLTPYMTSMTAKFKGLGYDIDDATTLAQNGLNLAADASAFWDKSLEDSMGALNSFINGSYEGGEAIGLFANDTQLASYAVKNSIVSETKEWSNLDEAKKQATRLQYAQDMMQASGATGQAAKEAGQYANVQANLTEKWRQFKSQIGEPLLQNIVIPAMDKLSDVVDSASQKFEEIKPKLDDVKNKFTSISDWINQHKALIEGLAVVIGSLTAGILAYNVAMTAKSIAEKAATLGSQLHAAASIKEKLAILGVNTAMLSSPITWVVAAIAGLIGVIILLVKNWDTVKETALNVWEKIKEIWGTVSEWFKTNIIDPIVNFFKGLWEDIVAIWDSIKNAIDVAIMFIVEIIKAAFNLITLPWRFIWENIKEYVFAAWESIKTGVTNAINKVKEVIETITNAIKSVVLPIWENIKSGITNVVDKVKENVTNIWNKIKEITGRVFDSLKSTVQKIWVSIRDNIINPIISAKEKAATVIDNIKTKVTDTFNKVKNSVTDTWNRIKDAIMKPINKAKNTVEEAIDKIKGYFDFEWEFPKLKMPHFSFSGKFNLDPPSVPKFNIEWYAKGGILDEPTMFGFNKSTGSAMVGGEAGPEAVTPIAVLLDYVRTAVREENSDVAYQIEKLIALLDAYLPKILANMVKSIILDSGVLVGELGGEFDRKLGDISKMKARGM